MNPIEPASGSPASLGPEAVLALFARLVQTAAPVEIETEDGVQVEGRVTSLEADRGRLVLDLPKAPLRGLDADDEVDLFLVVEGTRWVAHAFIHHHFEARTRFSLLMPQALDPADRRREPRVCLEPSERIYADLTPGEPGHVQLRGRIANLSEGGCRVVVEEGLDTRTGLPFDPAVLPLESGQVVDLMVIHGLREGALETQARIVDAVPDAFGPVLGLRFKYLPAAEREAIRAFVAARLAHPSPPLGSPLPSRPVPSLAHEEPPADRRTSLLRLKKRLRTLLVLMSAGPTRDMIERFLRQEGWTRLILASDPGEVAEAFRSGPVHAAYVDGDLESMTSLEGVAFLHFARGEQACPVLLVQPGLAEPPPGVDRLLPRRHLGAALNGILEEVLGLGEGAPAASPVSRPAPAEARLKRFTSLALVMPEGRSRDELLAFLGREGFTRIHPAGTLMEFASLVRTGAPDLCFLDWPGPGSVELDLVHFLASYPFTAMPRLVLAQDQVTSRMAQEATALGVTKVLLKPYALDQNLVATLLGSLTE